MTGLTMPKAVIASLLNGGAQPGQHVGILNLSPYDGCLEKVALSWHLDHPERHLSSMALSTDMDVIAYNEKVVALYLIEVWDSNLKHIYCKKNLIGVIEVVKFKSESLIMVMFSGT